MATGTPAVPSRTGWKQWGPLGFIGVIAVIAGLVLPQMLPEASPAETAPPPAPGGSLSYQAPSWPTAPNYQGMFLRLGLGTAGVLALCVATLWVCKRWVRAVAPVDSANAQLRLIETLPLGGRCCLHLVNVSNRPVLIGVDSGGIKTVVPLPESFAGTLLETQAETPSVPGDGGVVYRDQVLSQA